MPDQPDQPDDQPEPMAPTPLERLDVYGDTANFLAAVSRQDADGAVEVLAQWSAGTHCFLWTLAHMTQAMWMVMQAHPELDYGDTVHSAAVHLTDQLIGSLRAEGRLADESWEPPILPPEAPPSDG